VTRRRTNGSTTSSPLPPRSLTSSVGGKDNFDDDIALRRALERCLEIIGEAAKALGDETRVAIAEVPWTEVIRLRDRLSHHYHRIEAEQLWVTAEVDAPRMATAIKEWRTRQGAE